MTEEGVYPIRNKKTSSRNLDKGRKIPIVKIARQQLPLAQAFALTVHAAQRQTMLAAIVDLQIGRGTSPISSYVAITRVEGRESLLIYRPFDQSLFTKGPQEGTHVLLLLLLGARIDCAAFEEMYTLQRRCFD